MGLLMGYGMSVAGIVVCGNKHLWYFHYIEILLSGLKKFVDISKEIIEAAKLTTYAIQTRYPGEYDDVTKEEYEKSIEIAKACLDWVEKTIENGKIDGK